MESIVTSVPAPAANPGTVTFTQVAGQPLVVNKAAHGLVAGTPVSFPFPPAAQSLPTGLVANSVYFVSATGNGANAFQITYVPDGSGGIPACIIATDAGVGANLTCNTEIARINCDGVKTVGIEIKNIGATNAFTSCVTYGRTTRGNNNPNNGGTEFQLAATTEYTTPTYPVIKSSATPATLAAAGSVWVVVNVEGFSELIIRAYATGGTTAAVKAHMKLDRAY